MNILFTYIRKYLIKNKSSTLLSILSIACASCSFFLVVCLCANSFIGINESTINSYGNYHSEYVHVQSKFIESIHLHQKVESVNLIEYKEKYEVNDFILEHKDSFYLVGIEETTFNDLGFQLIKGRYPKKTNEIIISTNALNNIKLNLNLYSTIQLNSNEYEIVGIMSNPFIENNQSYYTLISINESTYSQNAYVRFKSQKEAYNIAQQIADSFPEGFEEMKINNKLLFYDNQTIRPFIIMIMILIGSTFLFMNILLITNCYKNSYVNREKHVAILKTVGVTHYQCRTMIMYEGIILLVISLVVGLVSGWFIYNLVANYLNQLLFNVSVDAFIIQKKFKLTILLMTILYVSCVSFISLRRSTKKIVLQNVSSTFQSSDEVEVINHPYLELDKKEPILYKLFKKNLQQNKRAYRPLMIGLTIIFSIFIFVNCIMGYLREGIFFDAHDHNFDVEVIIQNDTYPTSVMTQLKNQKHASSVVISEKTTLETKDISFFEMDYLNMLVYNDVISLDIITYSDEIIKEKLTQNQWDKMTSVEEPMGILINKAYNPAYKRYYSISQSNELRHLNYHSNPLYSSIHLISTDELITGIDYQKYPQIIVSHELFDQIFEKENKKKHEYHIYFQSNDSSSLVKDIHSISFNDLDYEIVNEQENIQSSKVLTSIIRYLFYGYVMILGIMGILIVCCVTSINFDYRKKEFLLYRLFGLQMKNMMYLVFLELLHYLMKIFLYGWIISQGFNYLLYRLYFSQLGLKFYIPENSIIGTLVSLIIVLFLFTSYIYLRMKSQKYSQVLKNEISLM
ncbi:MAG: ABC transporter permease [Traorella sp.]